jgi:hypothetical protein
MMTQSNPISALEADVTLGIGLSVSAFLIPGREFRYGASYVSELLGHAENYFRQSLSRRIKTPSKKLKALKSKGFTAYKIRVKAPRKEGGVTITDTIGYDDFSIWVEYEAVVEKNPKAIALLTSSFREVLFDRTQKAFNLPDLSEEEKIERFGLSFSEREALWEEDRVDLESLLLPGDENGYDLFQENFLLAVKYDSLLADYGIASIRC